MILLVLISVLLLALILLLRPSKKIREYGAKIPGPKPVPLVGNIREVCFGYEGAEIYLENVKIYGDVLRYWLGHKLVVILSDPPDAEVIFRDSQNLSKSDIYEFLHPWLGTGLLTSTGLKWHLRRKAITPTFHFKVLEQFLEIFEKKSKIFVDCLSKKANGEIFDVHSMVSRFSLDVICESAMGTSVDAQTTDEPYVTNIRRIGDFISDRITKVWLHPNILFKLFGKEREQRKILDVIHGFTNKVMKEKARKLEESTEEGTTDEFGIKKKTAFLELLMKMRAEKNVAFVTEEDIREEVDTFMFEGHDTTASAISFAIHNFGKYPEFQAKAYSEVYEVFSKLEGPLTMEVLQNLNYLERFIKEVLRIYPSVPLVAREIVKDIELPSGYVLPAGCVACICMAGVHLNEKYWPDPLTFDPDRFLPESIASRHPYSYVPFSAGPRNCIGQKFAMLELKAVLSMVLLNFEIGMGEDTKPGMVLTLQSDNGHQVSFRPRQNNHTH